MSKADIIMKKIAAVVEGMLKEQDDRNAERRQTYLRAMPFADATTRKLAEVTDKGDGDPAPKPDKRMIGIEKKEQTQVKKAANKKKELIASGIGTGALIGGATYKLPEHAFLSAGKKYDSAQNRFNRWTTFPKKQRIFEEGIARWRNAEAAKETLLSRMNILRTTRKHIVPITAGASILGVAGAYLKQKQQEKKAAIVLTEQSIKEVYPVTKTQGKTVLNAVSLIKAANSLTADTTNGTVATTPHQYVGKNTPVPITPEMYIRKKLAGVLPGGLADKEHKTLKDFNPKAIAQGAKVESEHTSNKSIQKEIAMDHLTEDPKYYDKLKKMEKKSEMTGIYRNALAGAHVKSFSDFKEVFDTQDKEMTQFMHTVHKTAGVSEDQTSGPSMAVMTGAGAEAAKPFTSRVEKKYPAQPHPYGDVKTAMLKIALTPISKFGPAFKNRIKELSKIQTPFMISRYEQHPKFTRTYEQLKNIAQLNRELLKPTALNGLDSMKAAIDLGPAERAAVGKKIIKRLDAMNSLSRKIPGAYKGVGKMEKGIVNSIANAHKSRLDFLNMG